MEGYLTLLLGCIFIGFGIYVSKKDPYLLPLLVYPFGGGLLFILAGICIIFNIKY